MSSPDFHGFSIIQPNQVNITQLDAYCLMSHSQENKKKMQSVNRRDFSVFHVTSQSKICFKWDTEKKTIIQLYKGSFVVRTFNGVKSTLLLHIIQYNMKHHLQPRASKIAITFQRKSFPGETNKIETNAELFNFMYIKVALKRNESAELSLNHTIHELSRLESFHIRAIHSPFHLSLTLHIFLISLIFVHS